MPWVLTAQWENVLYRITACHVQDTVWGGAPAAAAGSGCWWWQVWALRSCSCARSCSCVPVSALWPRPRGSTSWRPLWNIGAFYSLQGSSSRLLAGEVTIVWVTVVWVGM